MSKRNVVGFLALAVFVLVLVHLCRGILLEQTFDIALAVELVLLLFVMKIIREIPDPL